MGESEAIDHANLAIRCFFTLKREYVVPIEQVKEIIHHAGAIRLPNVPIYMEEIINLIVNGQRPFLKLVSPA